MTEEWRDVLYYRNGKLLKFDGYQVELFSQKVRSFKRYKKGRILKTHLDKDGYRILCLFYNQKRANYALHRIVASTFIPNPLNLPQINHKNIANLTPSKNKLDNRVENLEWCNASHNQLHAYRELGKHAVKGEKQGQSKLTDIQVKEIIKLLDDGKLSHQQIADKYGMSRTAIDSINNRRCWAHLTTNRIYKKGILFKLYGKK